MEDLLTIRYVGLDTLEPWLGNPKKHDIGALITSFKKYGFKVPLRFEPFLNKEQGGVIAGNGRKEALERLILAGEEPPRGIGRGEDGLWLVPVLFGVDARSEAEAMAFGVDDNATVVTGGDFGPDWQRRLYNLDDLEVVLNDLCRCEEMPISIDLDDLEGIKALTGDEERFYNQDTDSVDSLGETNSGPMCICPTCGAKHRSE